MILRRFGCDGRVVLDDHDGEFIAYTEHVRLMNAKQAEIDTLMLEFCPEDMTVAQIKNWENHQVAAEDDPELDNAVRGAI